MNAQAPRGLGHIATCVGQNLFDVLPFQVVQRHRFFCRADCRVSVVLRAVIPKSSAKPASAVGATSQVNPRGSRVASAMGTK